ncbi:MAG: hypothetical protein A3I61_08515 [Acidobacteria bacterium RIFCSPLOWO2_02_FULL_68_18]|nr:MAG: hypothetical protein A3I61_08515 [Acidobacteria bacterium RIFCSPLOWO2_02_FULL_68_18]OFW48892.1 MAG: hypothetical protein A3G77_01635 [Acidobacteria bacterium RIFCSPLOWO2_12_FULL_68_19]
MAAMRSVLAFAGGLATLVLLVGAQDLESYDHAFFSLDRGTATEPVRAMGQPVYTLAFGLGVRLPLHGSLGASPAAALAPLLPAPLTYWLLLAVAVAAASLVVRQALEPTCGRLCTWLALPLLFCSVPIVNYTVFSDWPETAVTYCALVAGVFAPHAFLALRESPSPLSRRLGGPFVAGAVWGLMGAAHPGYWPLLAGTVVVSAALVLWRSEHPLGWRLAAAGGLGVVALLAVAPQAPDILREVELARAGGGGMRRIVQGAEGSLVAANAFPFTRSGARSPFTFLALALASIVIGGRAADRRLRRLTVGSAAISLVFGLAATALSPGQSTFAPSNTWTFRDPAIGFAVLGAAGAAAAVGKRRVAAVALGIAALQGPAYAGYLVVADLLRAADRSPWTHDFRAPAARLSARGLPRERVLPGGRLALWPGAGDRMRNARNATADFADAGYLLVTTWTKQRTMQGLIEPNDLLFNQMTELPPSILCEVDAVRFLQLRYLLFPDNEACPPWSPLAGVKVDGWLSVGIAERDDRVRALRAAAATASMRREPALTARSRLLPALAPLPGTSLLITARAVVIRVDDLSVVRDQVLVLPVAYDAAWRASSGSLESVGGLVALAGVDQAVVTLEFVPDRVALARASSMTLAQILTAVGLIGLLCLRTA